MRPKSAPSVKNTVKNSNNNSYFNIEINTRKRGKPSFSLFNNNLVENREIGENSTHRFHPRLPHTSSGW